MNEEFNFPGLLRVEEESALGQRLDEIVDFKAIFKKRKFIGLLLEAVD